MRLSLRIIGATLVLFGVATFTNIASAQTANAACVDNVYSYNLTVNTCVKYIQRLTNSVSKDNPIGVTPLVVDGQYGSKTKGAIRTIQAHSGGNYIGSNAYTPFTQDGIVGRQSWAALCQFGGRLDYTAYISAGCQDSNGNPVWQRYFSSLSIGY